MALIIIAKKRRKKPDKKNLSTNFNLFFNNLKV